MAHRHACLSSAEWRTLGGAILAAERSQSEGSFGLHDGALLMLHAFIKKTQKMLPTELALARRRLKEMSS